MANIALANASLIPDLGGSATILGFVLAAAFGAGLVDSIGGGGGMIQVPALFAGFPGTTPSVLLGTNKLGSICGTMSAVWRYRRVLRGPQRGLLQAAVMAFFAAIAGNSGRLIV